MTQHTPGPWDDQYPQHSPGEIHVYGADGNVIGSVWGIEDGAQKDPTSAANARLIAAAPELLEALLSIRGDMGDGGEWEGGLENGGIVGPTALRKVAAAIAKAEGGE